VAIKPIFWITLFIVTLPVANYIASLFKRGVDYEFNTHDWPHDWIHHGGVKVVNQPMGLKIKHSSSGCLFDKYHWKDFEVSFEAKFLQDITKLNHRSFGILFRSLNLESYFMLELQADKTNGDLYVKPHVRFLGQWEFVDWEKVGTYNLDKIFNIKLWCKGRFVKVYINNSQLYEWILPDKIDFRGQKQQEPTLDKSDDKNTSLTVLDLPFMNKYGLIGFRADWGQGAIIRDLKIKTLSQFDKTLFSIIRHKS